jgi:cytosine/adenosine deaminase-related metal-dependent hydrolase
MMRLLVRGGHVVPGDGGSELPRADVFVVGGSIAAIGPDLSAEDTEVVDAAGLVVMPGFVDSHRHVWQAPLRGAGADMTLPDYFRVVLGHALPRYRPADARLATLLGAAEALDAGVTTVFDWSNTTLSPEHTDAVVDGFAAAGIRAIVGHTNPGVPASAATSWSTRRRTCSSRCATRCGPNATGPGRCGPRPRSCRRPLWTVLGPSASTGSWARWPWASVPTSSWWTGWLT